MITITRRLEFDAGHRVLGHEGKCKHLHGHRYASEITVSAPELDPLGRVIDFGEVKRLVGGWIDQNWDHNLLLHKDDPLLEAVEMADQYAEDAGDKMPEVFGGKAVYIMPSGNPTAENMAKELYRVSCLLLRETGITVTKIRLYETPNSYADYTPE